MNSGPINLQFLRDHYGRVCTRTLPKLRFLDKNGDPIVGGNSQPCVGFEDPERRTRRPFLSLSVRRKVEAENQGSGNPSTCLQKLTPGKLRMKNH